MLATNGTPVHLTFSNSEAELPTAAEQFSWVDPRSASVFGTREQGLQSRSVGRAVSDRAMRARKSSERAEFLAGESTL